MDNLFIIKYPDEKKNITLMDFHDNPLPFIMSFSKALRFLLVHFILMVVRITWDWMTAFIFSILRKWSKRKDLILWNL